MLEGWEWIIVGIVAVVIIIWGPTKIPEFAKALGKARGEFSKATKEFTQAAAEVEHAKTVNPKNTSKIREEELIETAQKLGIPTEGKTREQISSEISAKIGLLTAQ